jgi:hypothetical protein
MSTEMGCGTAARGSSARTRSWQATLYMISALSFAGAFGYLHVVPLGLKSISQPDCVPKLGVIDCKIFFDMPPY